MRSQYEDSRGEKYSQEEKFAFYHRVEIVKFMASFK